MGPSTRYLFLPSKTSSLRRQTHVYSCAYLKCAHDFSDAYITLLRNRWTFFSFYVADAWKRTMNVPSSCRSPRQANLTFVFLFVCAMCCLCVRYIALRRPRGYEFAVRKCDKVDGMVDVVKPRCRGDDNGCPRRPTFGRPADKVPTFCKAHKPPGMVDVANPRCTHPDCQRRPSFGVTRGRRALRCATHKLKGMVDVRKPRCQEPSCERIAYFNVKEVKGATRCSRHQEEGMVRK